MEIPSSTSASTKEANKLEKVNNKMLSYRLVQFIGIDIHPKSVIFVGITI